MFGLKTKEKPRTVNIEATALLNTAVDEYHRTGDCRPLVAILGDDAAEILPRITDPAAVVAADDTQEGK